MYTELLSQALAIAADGIHPASQSTSEKLTAAIDLSVFPQVLFIIDVGVEGTSATVDFQVKGSATSGGTYTAIPGTAITQFVKASNDNNYALVCVAAEKVQTLGYGFIKGSLVPGTAASQASVVAIGALTRFEPASAQNATTVAQVLSLFR